MRNPSFRYGVIFIALLLLSSSLEAAELPEDKREVWRVGLAEFRGRNLSTNNLYLLTSIPLQLNEALALCPTHEIGEIERSAYQRYLITREVAVKRVERQDLYKDLDGLIFKRGAVESDRAGIERRIEEASVTIRDLAQADPGQVTVRDVIPVELAGNTDATVLPPVSLSPALLAEEESLDLLVWGFVEEIRGYLFADLHVYNSAIGETDTYSTAGSREEFFRRIEEMADYLFATVLGREWAVLEVSTQPEDAGIWIDGSFRGIGSTTLPLIRPGTHSLRIEAEGYRSVSESLEIEPRANASRAFTLESVQQKSSLIVSYPSGADVYIASEWAGSTPLDLSLPPLPKQGIVRREGYNDYLLTLGDSLPEEVELELAPVEILKPELLSESRDRFYFALGAFVLSVPFPIMLLDEANNLTFAAGKEDDLPQGERNADEINRLLRQRSFAVGGYVGSMLASASLLILVITELLSYINIVDLSIY